MYYDFGPPIPFLKKNIYFVHSSIRTFAKLIFHFYLFKKNKRSIKILTRKGNCTSVNSL